MGGLCSGGEEAQTIKPIINPDNKVNNNISNAPPKEPRVKEEIDPNKIQYCRRCSTTYKEKDNTSESCVYHPGKFGRNTSSTTPWHSAEVFLSLFIYLLINIVI